MKGKRILALMGALALLLCSGCANAAVQGRYTAAEKARDLPEDTLDRADFSYQITLEEAVTLTVGEQRALEASVDHGGTLAWSCDNEVVAQVSPEGVVTALAAGTCVVTATCENDDAVTAQCTVTVENLPEPERTGGGRLIAIDAGHQARGDNGKEPLGPGSGEMKTRVAGGTRGVVTGLAEYELTLQVALKLQTELEARGYQVLMIRTTNDVNISNAERAQMANEAGAAALIRIHADGSESAESTGAMTICMTPSNPYNGALYDASRALSQAVVDGLCAATGAKNRGVWETDTMTGINWSQVPVTIVEMGFMTNPTEDQRMASDDYQNEIVSGIADGVDACFEG